MEIRDLQRRNVTLSRTWFENQDWERFGVNIGECMEYTFITLLNLMTRETLSGEPSDPNIVIDANATPEAGRQDRSIALNPPGLGGATRANPSADAGSPS